MVPRCSFDLHLSISNAEHLLCVASLIAQLVKNPPAMQETLVRALGQEDPLGKEMATYSSILAWRIPGKMGWNGLQCMGSQTVGHD